MNQGFKFCKASEGSVIMMSELIFVGIAGVIVFKEVLSTCFLAGACLVLGSGIGLNLIHRGSRDPAALEKSSADPGARRRANRDGLAKLFE
jgi:hypothetical protein